jgi:hypothetical protein
MVLTKFYVKFLPFLFLCGVLCSDAATKLQFDSNLCGLLEIVEIGNGDIDFENNPSGAEINSVEGGFTGMIGANIAVPDLHWRQYYHWWNMTAKISGLTETGGISLVIICLNNEQHVIRAVDVYKAFPTKKLFSEIIYKECLAVAKAHPNDIENKVTNVRVGLLFENWRGRLKITELMLKKFELDNRDSAPYQRPDFRKAEIGAMGWFDPSYTQIGTATESMRDTAHKLFAVAGINKMRFMAIWGDHFREGNQFRVEPTFEVRKGEYDFEKLDKYIEELDYYGHSIGVLTLWGTPFWAHTKTKADVPDYKKKGPRAAQTVANATFPPDDWADYANFVTKLVSRYQGRIEGYEVWNEPDVWNYGLVLGYEAYIDYLKNFYTAAKSVDQNVNVYAGRLGLWTVPAIEEGGIDEYCDAIADHPYPGTNTPASASRDRIEEVVKSMIATDTVKPLIVTEVGMGAGYPWPGPGGFHGEEKKSEKALDLIKELDDYAGQIYWYTPIQAGRMYGILQYVNDRYRPNPIYYRFAEYIDRMNNGNAPVVAAIDIGKEPAQKGRSHMVKLEAKNLSHEVQSVMFWPLGLIDDLGYSSFKQIRKYDRKLTLQPGEIYSCDIPLRISSTAFGKYPIGLALISDKVNSLAIEELPVWSIVYESQVRASSCDQGSPEAVKSLYEPVWSGDIDVPGLIWHASTEPRSEWVELEFDREHQISQVCVYWAANPKPRLHFEDIAYDTQVVPESWKLYYRSDGKWLPVEAICGYTVSVNQYNTVKFNEVTADAIRLEASLKKSKNAGILRLRIE